MLHTNTCVGSRVLEGKLPMACSDLPVFESASWRKAVARQKSKRLFIYLSFLSTFLTACETQETSKGKRNVIETSCSEKIPQNTKLVTKRDPMANQVQTLCGGAK